MSACGQPVQGLSLPLTLQEATAVLASMQPSAAAASSSGGDGSACTAAAAFPAMQDCDALHGCFGSACQHTTSARKGVPVAASTRASGSCSGSSSASSFNTSAPPLDRLAAPSSHPFLSMDSCTEKIKALTALPIRYGTCTCSKIVPSATQLLMTAALPTRC